MMDLVELQNRALLMMTNAIINGDIKNKSWLSFGSEEETNMALQYLSTLYDLDAIYHAAINGTAKEETTLEESTDEVEEESKEHENDQERDQQDDLDERKVQDVVSEPMEESHEEEEEPVPTKRSTRSSRKSSEESSAEVIVTPVKRPRRK